MNTKELRASEDVAMSGKDKPRPRPPIPPRPKPAPDRVKEDRDPNKRK